MKRRKVAWSLKVMCTGQVQSLILAGVNQTEHVETKKEYRRPARWPTGPRGPSRT